MTALYHYTCDCGRRAIGDPGLVLPIGLHSPEAAARVPDEWAWLVELCWFTTQAQPDAVALGLTKETIACDRTRWRYRVTDPTGVEPWTTAARTLPRNAYKLTLGDHRPGLWWIARGPVPVEMAT